MQIGFVSAAEPDLYTAFGYLEDAKGFVPISAYDYSKNPVISTMPRTMESVKSFTQR